MARGAWRSFAGGQTFCGLRPFVRTAHAGASRHARPASGARRGSRRLPRRSPSRCSIRSDNDGASDVETRAAFDTPPTDQHQRKEGDSGRVVSWRARMVDDEMAPPHEERAAAAERLGALARNRGLQCLPWRRTSEVRAEAHRHVPAHDLMCTAPFVPRRIGRGTGAAAVAAAAACGESEGRGRIQKTPEPLSQALGMHRTARTHLRSAGHGITSHSDSSALVDRTLPRL